MSKGIQLKDLTSVVEMDYQPVCLSVCLSINKDCIEDDGEKSFYNSWCDVAGRDERLDDTDFMKIVEEYRNYYVWDISVSQDDFEDPYLIISAVKTKPEE